MKTKQTVHQRAAAALEKQHRLAPGPRPAPTPPSRSALEPSGLLPPAPAFLPLLARPARRRMRRGRRGMAGDGGGGRGAAAVPAAAGAGAPRVSPAGEGSGRGAASEGRGRRGSARGAPPAALGDGPAWRRRQDRSWAAPGGSGRGGRPRAVPPRRSPRVAASGDFAPGLSPFAPASLRLRLRLLPCPPVFPGLKARLLWDRTPEPASSVEHVGAGRAGGTALQAADKELRLGGKSCLTEVLLRSCAGALVAWGAWLSENRAR